MWGTLTNYTFSVVRPSKHSSLIALWSVYHSKKLNLRFLAANPSSPILCKLIEVLVESYILCNSLHQHLCKIWPYKNCLAQTLQHILSSVIAPGYFGSITSKAFMKSILNNLYQHLALNKICTILFQTVLCAYIQHGSFCFTS